MAVVGSVAVTPPPPLKIDAKKQGGYRGDFSSIKNKNLMF